MATLWDRVTQWFCGNQRRRTLVVDLKGEQGGQVTSVKGLRVLLIDDSDETRTLLSGALRLHGAQVTAVASAREAAAVLERLDPHVVVSNSGLEHADAFTVIRAVRAIEAQQRRRIPTITFSAAAPHALPALTLGFQIHVREPLAPPRLVSLIGKLAAAGRIAASGAS